MKFVLLVIGKTKESYLINGIDLYSKRLQHYINFEIIELNKIKNKRPLGSAANFSKSWIRALVVISFEMDVIIKSPPLRFQDS